MASCKRHGKTTVARFNRRHRVLSMGSYPQDGEAEPRRPAVSLPLVRGHPCPPRGRGGLCGHRRYAWPRHRRHVRRQLTWAVFAPTTLRRVALAGTDVGRPPAARSAPERVPPPDRRLGPHGHLATGVRTGAEGREHFGGRIQHGAAAGHCACASQGPALTSSPAD